MAKRLENDSEPTNHLLLEIAQKTTTSMMYTSITNESSHIWLKRGEKSETIQIELNLAKLPESYLEQIFTGKDLDIEVVMPFTTLDQIEAMQRSLTILP